MAKLQEIDIDYQSDPGSPDPFVLCTDYANFLLFYNKGWDEEENEIKVIKVKFERCIIYKSGSPSNETSNGHKYYNKGFRPYSIFEVLDSDWVQEVKKIESVHPYFNKESFKKLKHYIFSFHDSTFECIAEEFKVEGLKVEMKEAVQGVLSQIFN